jgi:hypothetical protein
VDVVHLLVKRPVWVAGEFDGAGDGGVVRAVAGVVWAVDGEAVDEQVHAGVAAHVDRLAAALDGAEQDVVAVLLDEDHRGLGLPIGIDGGQDAEMGTARAVLRPAAAAGIPPEGRSLAETAAWAITRRRAGCAR